MNQDLAVPRPVMPVSDVEQNALKELMPKLNTEGCEAKAAKLKEAQTLQFEKKIEPTVAPYYLLRKNAEEREKIENAIAAMRKA